MCVNGGIEVGCAPLRQTVEGSVATSGEVADPPALPPMT